MTKINVVHFGAGNIGRGLLAHIYQKNNAQITFIDSNQELIKKLHNAQTYNIVDIETKQKTPISNYNVILSDDEAQVLKALKNADIISTSIGSNNLISLKSILDKFYTLDKNSKIVICFENGFKISNYLKSLLAPKENWNFINASTDRIIPATSKNNLDVEVENFYEIVLEDNDLLDALKLKGVIYTQHLDSYILRKLLMVNALHSGIGYMGFILKQKYISQSLQLNSVQNYVSKMIDLIVEILIKYDENFTKLELDLYAQKIVERLKNPHLKDLVTRVARNPLTKIAKNERYDLLLQKAKLYNLSDLKMEIIYQNFVNVLLFDYDQDKQSQEMQYLINVNLQKFLENYTNLNFDQIQVIQKMYNQQMTIKELKINE